jgi:uncharacterized protein YndB with AHSA1/START domain
VIGNVPVLPPELTGGTVMSNPQSARSAVNRINRKQPRREAGMKIEQSIEIAAGAEKIWPFLIEPENIVKWCSTVKTISHTSQQRTGLKTHFYFEERAGGRLMKLHFVITEWIVNRSIAFKMTSGNVVKGYEQRYTLEPIPSGTRFTCFENVILPFGIMGKFLELFRRPVSEAHIRRMLLQLKILGEV